MKTISVFSAHELAEELGVSERDVIDTAHDAGCREFRENGRELEWEDFDKLDCQCFERGCGIDLDDVEIVIDQPEVIERFNYLTGAGL